MLGWQESIFIEEEILTRTGRNKILAAAIVCALALTLTAPPKAQATTPIGGVTKSDAAWIAVAVAAIGAGIGIGIYYAIHHGHSLSGCAVGGANGLELQNQSDQQTYTLVGAVAGIKPGERVRVSGKKVKRTAGPAQQFLVEQLSKDYGVCSATP
ncbi:MAG: hypothetical protein ABSD44_08815 [Terracidiphilus sp.]